jgi:S1-C subfamily serine protease
MSNANVPTNSRMRFSRKNLLLSTLVCITILALTACGGSKYTVTFDLNGGSLIGGDPVQTVTAGNDAVAPEAVNGHYALSWDTDFTDVSSDLSVTAVWEKMELSPMEIASIVQAATVTVNCSYFYGGGGSGSGFFIDQNGTIVTSYHVIEYANAIDVDMPDGSKYTVSGIIAFDEMLDLAILKIDTEAAPALTICKDAPQVGEPVYANGSALGTLDGTFTSGTISSTSREVNGISCIQMDAAISSGNSGGPLVNRYGEVIGVNAMSYNGGENLNLAVKIDNLDHLTEINYSVNDYEEWIIKESDRSYAPFDDYGYYYSTINTYTHVTGRACSYSLDFELNIYEGYLDSYYMYVYNYVESESDAYVEYLKTKGFEYYEREALDGGVTYYYLNEWSGIFLSMTQFTSSENLIIQVFYL